MTNVLEVRAPTNQDGTRATLLRWCRAPGERVAKDEPLVELETDKVTVEVAAPAGGVLVDVVCHPNDAVEPGAVLAHLRPEEFQQRAAVAQVVVPTESTPARTSTPARAATSARREGRLSPAVRRLLAERGLSAQDVAGSGRDGRITARDVERHAGPDVLAASRASGRVPHTPMRRRIAEHMARSVATAPHVTTLFEVDLTRIVAHRKAHGAEFEQRGARLTYTAYFVAACASALRAVPEVNATFHEDALEVHADVNIGVGTALGNEGLIVPVLHRADALDLFATAQRLQQLVAAARERRLQPDDVRGGTFTISNHGVTGSLLAAPIVIHQPQVAILGVGKVERRVVVHEIDGEDVIRVRPMCYLTLTIDHRALDAFQANAFLSTVVKTLESWPMDR